MSKKDDKTLSQVKELEAIIAALPEHIYWEDVDCVIQGCNDQQAQSAGFLSRYDLVGKTDYDMPWASKADEIIKTNKEVMQSRKTITSEERTVVDGMVRFYRSTKSPRYDEKGNVIGLLGISIDITEKKEAERLKIENEKQRVLLAEEEKFAKLANKVAHDIRSPLSSLTMIVKDCTQIPEEQRIALREAAIGIGDIANHLLNHYQKRESADQTESEERQPVLVSAILLESLTSKKYQYKNFPVQFHCHFEENTQFAFIKIGPSAFKRTLSNLMNNAADAFDGKTGEVYLRLESDNEWVKIVIEDTGKGMSPELVNKILRKTAVTEGKKSGHGIGLTQVWDTLENSYGEMTIDSKPELGTVITLIFPRIKAPYWIAEEITLNSTDTVIILDDDPSIHGAWRTRFENILTEYPQIELKHFQVGVEALEFIQSLTPDEKNKIFLLSDYELLQQKLNGLDVIAQSDINRSILVTSHYANSEVQIQAAKTGTQILPKQLASEIVIKIHEAALDVAEKIDAVIVDDNKIFLNAFLLHAFNDDEIVEEYHNPEHFLKNVHKYDKDTRIYLDNNYDTSQLKGLDIAKQLHELGYTKIILLSGEVLKEENIPSYITLIGKNHIEKLKKS